MLTSDFSDTLEKSETDSSESEITYKVDIELDPPIVFEINQDDEEVYIYDMLAKDLYYYKFIEFYKEYKDFFDKFNFKLSKRKDRNYLLIIKFSV
jgi:hypothetical protein